MASKRTRGRKEVQVQAYDFLMKSVMEIMYLVVPP